MSYKKDLIMKIIRTTHVVSFYDKSRAMDIIADLSQVPREARLIEVRESPDPGMDIVGGANNPHTLVFELEENQPCGS